MGSVLGDGCLEMSKWGSARLQLKQSVEKREYIFWLFGELGSLCRSAPKQKKDTLQWYFSTRYSKELASLWEHFYRDKKKIIPKNIGEMLSNPISLAVWFMDDGTLDWREKSHYAFRIATNCFSKKENELLAKVLKQNFGVDATVQTSRMRGIVYPRIHIGAAGRDKFLREVAPFMSNCFRHKIPKIMFNPSETYPAMSGMDSDLLRSL